MNIKNNLTRALFISAIALLFSACSNNSEALESNAQETGRLTVYKNASCECCGQWVDHMDKAGFHTVTQNQDNLSEIKKLFGVPDNMRSCHTAVLEGGFVFEGHVPAKFIRQFLDEKPADAFGLSVPGMPTGTPGMEYGDKFQPYKIFLLKTDGSTEVYAEVHTAKEQHDVPSH